MFPFDPSMFDFEPEATYQPDYHVIDDNHVKPRHIYLDDERRTPEGWERAYTAMEMICMLSSDHTNIVEISLDHDLGDDVAGTGYDVLTWIENQLNVNPYYIPPDIQIHTANPSARDKMMLARKAIYTHVIKPRVDALRAEAIKNGRWLVTYEEIDPNYGNVIANHIEFMEDHSTRTLELSADERYRNVVQYNLSLVDNIRALLPWIFPFENRGGIIQCEMDIVDHVHEDSVIELASGVVGVVVRKGHRHLCTIDFNSMICREYDIYTLMGARVIGTSKHRR